MVILHFKRTELDQFIMETTNQNPIEKIIEEVSEVNNLRITIDKLCQGMEGLAEHGPLRPEALRGLTTPETYEPALETLPKEQIAWGRPKPEGTQRITIDKTGYRTGIAPAQEITTKMINECVAAKAVIHARNVEQKKSLSIKQLKETIDLLRGMVMIAYPAYHGLPPWEPVLEILEGTLEFLAYWPDCEWTDAKESTIWSCRKEWVKGKFLKDYIPNEKTKVVVKIAKVGTGQPVAEPQIDKETHSKMLAFYHKKQEEQKTLDQDDDDTYMNSAWANPNQLKNQLVNGGKDVFYRGGK